MRIVHILAYFKEDVAYQENYLTVGQKELGNEVYVVTSQLEPDFGVNSESRVHALGTYDYHGVTIIRTIKRIEFKNKFIIFKGLYRQLEKLKPDLIFFHDHSPELLTCVKYIKKHKGTRLRVDIHSSKDNSMHTLLGKIYFGVVWRAIIKHIQKYYDKLFCIAPECIDFATDIFKIAPDKIDFMPLPGDASYLRDYEANRKKVRTELGFSDDETVIYHTGKLPGTKKTKEVLQAFDELVLKNVKIYIWGFISEDFRPILDHFLEKNSNIHYQGWVSAKQLKWYLLGADALLQPGGPSNTFIEAICCGVPLVLANNGQGRELCKMQNGYLIDNVSTETIRRAIEYIAKPEEISRMRRNAFEASKEYHYVEVARKSLS